MEFIMMTHKNYPVAVLPMKASELDKTKCSAKFLAFMERRNQEDLLVYVKCDADGNFDYRKKSGNKLEYRIYQPNK